MKSCASLAVLVFAVGLCGAQNASEPPDTVKITVRLLNGKSGKPIKNDFPNIWVGDPAWGENPKTDTRGEVVLSVDIKRDRYIRVAPNYYADCRVKGDQNNGLDETKYSLEDIFVHGMVSNNVCGKNHVAPTPGVLVIYVRPRTFLEKWQL
jgi:hypothetical protein